MFESCKVLRQATPGLASIAHVALDQSIAHPGAAARIGDLSPRRTLRRREEPWQCDDVELRQRVARRAGPIDEVCHATERVALPESLPRQAQQVPGRVKPGGECGVGAGVGAGRIAAPHGKVVAGTGARPVRDPESTAARISAANRGSSSGSAFAVVSSASSSTAGRSAGARASARNEPSIAPAPHDVPGLIR